MAPRPPAGHEYVLTLTCPEAPGIVFAVSRFVMEHGGNISASQQFDDRLTDTFFMRVQLLHSMFRIDHRDDRVQHVMQRDFFIHEKSLRYRPRVGQAGGFDHDAVEIQLSDRPPLDASDYRRGGCRGRWSRRRLLGKEVDRRDRCHGANGEHKM